MGRSQRDRRDRFRQTENLSPRWRTRGQRIRLGDFIILKELFETGNLNDVLDGRRNASESQFCPLLMSQFFCADQQSEACAVDKSDATQVERKLPIGQWSFQICASV